MPKVELTKFHMPKFQLIKFHMPKVLYAKIPIAQMPYSQKNSAASAISAEVCASAFGPGSNPGTVKSFSKFDNWQL